MIGSFWNLCRACPSMPVDKLHSEYRSTYRWHEYTGPRQEVVRRAPQANATNAAGDKMNDGHVNATTMDEDVYNELPKLEPALPRRKKYPDLAYRHHEFLISDGGDPKMNGFGNADSRARSEERGEAQWRPSRRSKSEGPARCGDAVRERERERERERRRESDPDMDNMGRDTGLIRKTISKISSEYKRQFAWPQGHLSRKDAAGSTPRKSKSMGAIKQNGNAMVHKKRIDMENKNASELEPLVDDKTNHEEKAHNIYKEEINSEYKKNFRPFSQYEYSDGRFIKRAAANDEIDDSGPKSIPINCERGDSWFQEVVELRKKAGEYRNRGRGSDQIQIAPDRMSDIYNKQIELWDQVSRRSSLSALSLASMTHKNYTKEEKDEDNTKKSSPSKAHRNAENSARMVRDMIRHHLERTIGGPDFDGLILSPTRDKLEPTIPRKDGDSRSSQKSSPKKSSPMKTSSLKRSNQKEKAAKSGPRNGKQPPNATRSECIEARSQSVGPTDTRAEKRSPKRQSRSATVKERKMSGTTPSNKRPRPSSLNTTVSSRSKHSPVPLKKEDDRLAKPNSKSNDSKQKLGTKELRKGELGAEREKTDADAPVKTSTTLEAPKEPEVVNYEPVVKSPPEPTRVKSPEQILMRSPDPVNWTVPLDTGKTFTVTQNVREGDIGSRPHSEVKAWTPPDVPPPVAQSAPPTLTEEKKEQGMS